MAITFDPAKRARAIAERGLDFRDAEKLFAGLSFTRQDQRFEYGEDRFITAGYLDDRFVVLVWTLRGADRHIISLRHGHENEHRLYRSQLG